MLTRMVELMLKDAVGGEGASFKLEEYGEYPFLALDHWSLYYSLYLSNIQHCLSFFFKQLWKIELLLRSTRCERRSASVVPRN